MLKQRHDGNTDFPAQKQHSSGSTNIYSFNKSLLSTHYMQGIVLGAAIFEMTKLFVQVGSELVLDSVPDLRETECPHMAHVEGAKSVDEVYFLSYQPSTNFCLSQISHKSKQIRHI